MKNLLFSLIGTCLFLNSSYSQSKEMLILKNKDEICFMIKNDGGKYDENYIFQTDDVDKFEFKNNKVMNFKIIYDHKALIINIEKDTYYFIVDNYIVGNNVIKGYGLSRRKGVFEIVSTDENKSFFETITLVNSGGSSNCSSGGLGSTQCSIGSTNGPVGTECSVSCGAGYYACCDDSTVICKCITNPKVKSIQENRIFEIKMNPVENSIEFISNNDTENYKIVIFDFSGEILIKDQKLLTYINIENLNTGIYIYKIYNDKGYIQEGKFVKK